MTYTAVNSTLSNQDAGTEFVVAYTREHFAKASALMREFVMWCRGRYRARPWHVDLYFPLDALDAELASLEETYAAPGGAVLLAQIDGHAAGCVAMRPIGAGLCEMKRFYLRPEFQGFGLGRGLASALLDVARARGHRAMRLDTGDLQHEAQALYRSLGFEIIAPYRDYPPDLTKHMVFMEKAL